MERVWSTVNGPSEEQPGSVGGKNGWGADRHGVCVCLWGWGWTGGGRGGWMKADVLDEVLPVAVFIGRTCCGLDDGGGCEMSKVKEVEN